MFVEPFTGYPNMYHFSALYEKNDILPFTARKHSPVKVTVTPKTPVVKLESRVYDKSNDATFPYQLASVKDNDSSLNRLSIPAATKTTWNDLPPIISITKTDFRDPRPKNNIDSNFECAGLFRRSYTRSYLDLPHTRSLLQSRCEESPGKVHIAHASRCQTRSDIASESYINTKSDKRVTMVNAPGFQETLQQTTSNGKTSSLSLMNQQELRFGNIKYPERGLNYYNGYLPPEFSNEIAQHLEALNYSGVSKDEVSDKKDNRMVLISEQYYKPLVGERKVFMRESYPIMQKLYQPDDHLRVEGRQRFLNSKGHAHGHLYVRLKSKGCLKRLQQRSDILDLGNGKNSNKATVPVVQSSVESFQKQRERTYLLQSQAKEMISKPSLFDW